MYESEIEGMIEFLEKRGPHCGYTLVGDTVCIVALVHRAKPEQTLFRKPELEEAVRRGWFQQITLESTEDAPAVSGPVYKLKHEE